MCCCILKPLFDDSCLFICILSDIAKKEAGIEILTVAHLLNAHEKIYAIKVHMTCFVYRN